MVAYDYKAQRWVMGSDAAKLMIEQAREELEASKSIKYRRLIGLHDTCINQYEADRFAIIDEATQYLKAVA